MKENLIKFIIISLVAFFSVSMVYANEEKETYANAVSWIDKDGVIIGYKLDKFSPAKPIEKTDTTKVENNDEVPLGYIFKESLWVTIWFYVCLFSGLFILINSLGIIMLLVAKIMRKRQKKC